MPRHNAQVGRAFIVAATLAFILAVGSPWMLVRLTARHWSAGLTRVAPIVGFASCVGGILGFITVGWFTSEAIAAFFGRIEHNSLWGVPLVGAALCGFAVGAFAAPLGLAHLAARRGNRGVA